MIGRNIQIEKGKDAKTYIVVDKYRTWKKVTLNHSYTTRTSVEIDAYVIEDCETYECKTIYPEQIIKSWTNKI